MDMNPTGSVDTMIDRIIHFAGGYVVIRVMAGSTDVYEERWYDYEKQLHRDNGLPAFLDSRGYASYWEHGEPGRLDE